MAQITQKDKCGKLLDLVSTHPNISAEDKEMLTDFINGRVTALDKKTSSSKGKSNAEHEAFRLQIIEALSVLNRASTVTEIMATAPLCNIPLLQNQKVSRHLNDMVTVGTYGVERSTCKKKTLFALVEDNTEVEGE